MATIRNQKELEKWQFRVEKVIKHYLAQKPRENMINRVCATRRTIRAASLLMGNVERQVINVLTTGAKSKDTPLS